MCYPFSNNPICVDSDKDAYKKSSECNEIFRIRERKVTNVQVHGLYIGKKIKFDVEEPAKAFYDLFTKAVGKND